MEMPLAPAAATDQRTCSLPAAGLPPRARPTSRPVDSPASVRRLVASQGMSAGVGAS